MTAGKTARAVEAITRTAAAPTASSSRLFGSSSSPRASVESSSASTGIASASSSTSLDFPALKPLPRRHGIHVATLTLAAHHPYPLDLFSTFAYHSARSLGIPASRPAPLPKSKELVTVLRASFAHKKYQENFERRHHRRSIEVYDANREMVDLWLRYLKQNGIGGVGMRAKVHEFVEFGFGRKEIEGLEREFEGLEGGNEEIERTAEELVRQLSAPDVEEGELAAEGAGAESAKAESAGTNGTNGTDAAAETTSSTPDSTSTPAGPTGGPNVEPSSTSLDAQSDIGHALDTATPQSRDPTPQQSASPSFSDSETSASARGLTGETVEERSRGEMEAAISDAVPVEQEPAPVKQEAAQGEEEVVSLDPKSVPVEQNATPVTQGSTPMSQESIAAGQETISMEPKSVPVGQEAVPMEQEADPMEQGASEQGSQSTEASANGSTPAAREVVEERPRAAEAATVDRPVEQEGGTFSKGGESKSKEKKGKKGIQKSDKTDKA